MNTHVVVKPFEGPNGRQFQVGEKVDASAWMHTAKLVDQRRLRLIHPGEITPAVKESHGVKPTNTRRR